ncbi:MAG TPA: hypothetical protein DCQ06_09415, partial [Myxococcales bacterium]|nr:hypothetical protein [Myxococcales bacterium]
MAWRRLLRAYHRDVGYFVSALTLSYCISGLAVNHMADWNPNYQIHRSEHQVASLTGDPDEMQKRLIAALGLKAGEVRGRLQQSSKRFKLFLAEGGEVVADVTTGAVTLKLVRTRPGIFEINALHLNHLKGVWTYI